VSPASARRLRRRTGFARTIRPTFGREGHRERASDRASDRRGATRVREGHRERLTDAGPASSAKVIASDPQTRGHPRPRRSSRERARGRRRCDRPRATFVGDGHRDRATDAGPPASAKVIASDPQTRGHLRRRRSSREKERSREMEIRPTDRGPPSSAMVIATKRPIATARPMRGHLRRRRLFRAVVVLSALVHPWLTSAICGSIGAMTVTHAARPMTPAIGRGCPPGVGCQRANLH